MKKVLVSVIIPVCAAIAVLLGVLVLPPQTSAVTVTSTTNSYGGLTIIQLPPTGGNATNPAMTFKFEFWHTTTGTGNFTGPGDFLRVWLFVPQLNLFSPVAMVVSNPNSSAIANVRLMVNNTAIAPNVIPATPSQFLISNTTNNVILANLTIPLNIILGPPLPLTGNITIPPMAIELRGFDGTFTETSMTPLRSGYNITSTVTAMPAWARIWIPSMLGATAWMTEGSLAVQAVDIMMAP